MYVREIHIDNFRHLQNVHLGPFPQPTQLSEAIALAGPNGGGKSSVLELLGYALSNSWSLGWTFKRSFPTNAFEVAIALTPEEVNLVRQYIETTYRSTGTNLQPSYAEDVLSYFEENGYYYRAYNYAEGKYQENAALYNRMHNMVAEALRNYYSRPLGFSISSDRNYPSTGFQQQKLFSYQQMIQREYIWQMAFNTSEAQYMDMFDFLVQQRYHYFRRLGAYHHRLASLGTVGEEPPSDPLRPYDELLQSLFPGYSFAQTDEEVPSNLFVNLLSGEVVPFNDLSSGEKEVFFVLSFFLRHRVNNAMILIDEPEMHLHPELARLLVRTMQSIRPGNQLWMATHNAEIIDEAGRDRVVYLARDQNTKKSIVTLGTDESEAMRQLKDLFGYSGYVGIAKNMVFLEGLDSSSDRKLFTSLFPQYGTRLKFVPCKSSENLNRINAAILSILESNLGWMQFYLIRDRDFLTQEIASKYRQHASGRLYVLDRYHIENYLLDDELIAKVQTEIFNKPTDAAQVRSKLSSIARNISGEVLQRMTAFRLNLIYRPEDFSLGNFMNRQSILQHDGEPDYTRLESLKQEVVSKAAAINNSLATVTEPEQLRALVSEYQGEIQRACTGNSEGWRQLFPGRRLLEEYARVESLGKSVVLQNNLIKELSATPDKVAPELRRLVESIVKEEAFPAT